MTRGARILIAADAGAKVGGGHVMRCLTLAEALTRGGAECGFMALPAARAILDGFADTAFERFDLDEDTSASELAAAAATTAGSWGAAAIVADHYGFGPRDEAVLGAASVSLLIVDDLRRSHAQGLVLDSN